MDIKFHCDVAGNFPDGTQVRAFTYKDYSIEMHNHDFYEMNIVLAGSGTHCIENGRFAVGRGDVFVIPPMVAHAYTDTLGLEVYHILLQKDFLQKHRGEAEQVEGFLQLTEIEPFLRGNFSGELFLHLSPLQLERLQEGLALLDDHSTFSPYLKQHATLTLLYWLSALLDGQLHRGSDGDPRAKEPILRALEYLHQNYGRKITVDTLCELTYLSRSTFLRAFGQVCGLSPMKYLTRYRCKKALEMIAEGVVSKTEIAHACGFYDLSHMEKMLKGQDLHISSKSFKMEER